MTGLGWAVQDRACMEKNKKEREKKHNVLQSLIWVVYPLEAEVGLSCCLRTLVRSDRSTGQWAFYSIRSSTAFHKSPVMKSWFIL